VASLDAEGPQLVTGERGDGDTDILEAFLALLRRNGDFFQYVLSRCRKRQHQTQGGNGQG
jgi:hypothetical protein